MSAPDHLHRLASCICLLLSTSEGERTGAILAAQRVLRAISEDKSVDIHALAKRSPTARTLLDLKVVTLETLSLIRGELRRAEVKVLTDLAARLPLVLGDRVQIQQVLLNLIVNAMESMLPRQPQDRHLTIVSGREDDMVRVGVIDKIGRAHV